MPVYQYPTRLRVLRALTAAIGEIHPDRGYQTDLGPSAEFPRGKVFRGRILFGEGDPIPMVSILEVPIPPEQLPSAPDSSLLKGPWELIIQGFADDDAENPTDPAHVLMADVTQRLAVEKERNRDFQLFGMGDTVTNLSIGVGVVRPPDELSSKAYFWMPLRLEIAEDLKRPYED